MALLVADVKNFAEKKVQPSVDYYDKNNVYPAEIIELMKLMGLFGLTIPKIYDGLEMSFLTRVQVLEELSSVWTSLSIILDNHLRVTDYILNYGTDEQKIRYLPLLAKGQLIAADATNETNIQQIDNFETCLEVVQDSLEKWTLSGRKYGVINARHADIFAVSARIALNQNSDLKYPTTCIVLLETKADGLIIENEWHPMGIKGISLAPVAFRKCLIEKKNIFGEFIHTDKTFFESSAKNLSLALSAYSIGISRGLIEKCGIYLASRKRNGVIGSLSEEPVVRMRFGEIITKFEAANSLFKDCCSKIDSKSLTSFLACKIFTTNMVKEITISCMQLFGGSGYTSEYSIERCVRDALSLLILHSPSDISFDRLGQMVLKDIKQKEEHPPSISVDYAPKILPYVRSEYVLRATLNEDERIIDTGFYRNTNIQLFLYDMTTYNPSSTFKDLLGCLIFTHCLQNNISYFCAQSSGNAAMSYIFHARKNPSIKMVQFYLKQNSFKINATVIPNNVIMIENTSTEVDMKKALKRFSNLCGVPILPTLQLQIDSNKIRASVLNDIYNKDRLRFDWYVQALSSAYGPIGLYQGFTDIIQEGKQLVPPPKFLGVQQEAVCPFARALGYLDNGINIDGKATEILELTLFRSDPGEDLIRRVKYILDTYGGKIKVLTNDSFQKYLNDAMELVNKHNIRIAKTENNEICEKAGLISVAAVLEEIDNVDHGVFSLKEKVLIGFTGGSRCSSSEKIKPHMTLGKDPTDEQLKAIMKYL